MPDSRSACITSAVVCGALIAGCSLAGCGTASPDLAQISGTILLDRQPLKHVMVEFQPEGGSGSPSIGFTDDKGRYRLRFSKERWGALPGRHTVRINYDYDPRGDQPPPPVILPPRYHVHSELKRDVVTGRHVMDFHLDSAQVAGSEHHPSHKSLR